jgi:hypothetical protein
MTTSNWSAEQMGEVVQLFPHDKDLLNKITGVRDAIARGIIALQGMEASDSLEVSGLAGEALDEIVELLGTD